MQYQEAKSKFIQAWGTLGSSWGINRAMAQIHALLLISDKPLSTDEIMVDLQISRGNANMNIRALIDWGIVSKELRAGERKEFFFADKDIWELARQVSRERQKRELAPILKVLGELDSIEGEDASATEFKQVVKDLKKFTGNVNGVLKKFSNSDEHWFYAVLMKLAK